jgi:GntR family transcriptional repressor for pyruvate dehydrogenase complex
MRRKPTISTSVQLGPSLTEQVTDLLRAQITGGHYAAGESLPSEQNLSLEFGVSRAVIREALSRLKADKLVSGRPGRGAIVSSTIGQQSFRIAGESADDVESIVKIIELRIGLEVEAVGLAAVRRQARHLREMQSALDALHKAVAESSVARGIEADLRFHKVICEATNNDHFSAFFAFLVPFLRALLTVTKRNSMQSSSRSRKVEVEHRAIYKAIRAGDVDAARSAAREHMASTLIWLRSLSSEITLDRMPTKTVSSRERR